MVETITTRYVELKEVFSEKDGVVVIFGDDIDDCSFTVIATKRNRVYTWLLKDNYIE